MIVSNLFEVLAVVGFATPPLAALVFGLIFKFVVEQRLYKHNHDAYMDYERGYDFIISWYGGLFLMAIFGPLFWIDIWEAPNNVESASFIFLVWGFMLLFKWLWFANLYITRNRSMGQIKLLVGLDAAAAVVYSVLVLVTMHLADRPWYHWLVLLTTIIPAFEWVATLNADKYRQSKNTDISSEKPTTHETPVLKAGQGFFNSLLSTDP